MAKREVVEVTCDRCKKTETQGKDEGVTDGVEFEGALQVPGSPKLSIKYADLCRNCRRSVRNYFNRIAKVEEEKDEEKKVEKKPEIKSVISNKKTFA
jgi:hypothetical protein